MMHTTFRALVSLLIAFLGLTTPGQAQTNWVEAARYQQTAYFLFDSRIERYDLQSQSWLASTALPATGAKSIVASDRGVFVAIGTNIHRFDTNLGNRSILTTTGQPVVQLLMDGSMLVATQTGAGITALFYPLDGGSPQLSNITSNTWDLLGQASIAPGLNKIFGRSTVRGPLDIVQATYQPTGGLIAVTDSPHSGGTLPAGTKTYVSPDETLVVDNAGIVYSTANLSYSGSFGGTFTDIAFRGDGSSVVLRGNRLGIHDSAFRETSAALVSASASGIQLTADAAFAFIPETGARGVRAERVAFTAFAAGAIPTAADPAGLSYTPDQIMVDRDGVLLLYSAAHKTVFRWSPAEKRYLPGIGLDGAPAQITYSPVEHVLYMGSSTGAVTRVAAMPGSPVTAFTNVSSKVEQLVATGTHLLVVHYMFSDYMHRTFNLNGVQIDAEDRYSYSKSYAYSPQTRTVFWLNDRTTGGRLFSEVIGSDGILGPELETPYYKSGFAEDPPLRANATGTKVMMARGVLFTGSPLESDRETQRVSTDLAWSGETLFSLEPLTGGNTIYNRWTADWNVDQYRALEGSPLRVFPGTTQSVVVTLYAGSPRFHVLDAKDDSSFDSTSGRAPVISTQPQNTRTDYGGTARLRVLALGSGPFQYRWTKDGTEIPGSNSADLILENCGSKSAGSYQVTVSNATGNVTSSVARVGVGPVRNSIYTPGNLLVSSADKFHEVRTNGQIQRTLQVPHPFTTGFAHAVEDLAMDRLGRIHVVHRAFQGGYDLTMIGTLDPEFNTWSYTRLREPSYTSTNYLENDFSITGNTAVTNRRVMVDLANMHVSPIPGTELMWRHNITGAQDGFAYGVSDESSKIYRFDPRTWQLLQTSTVSPATGIYGATAAANGDIYFAATNKRLGKISPGTTGGTFLTMSNVTPDTYLDINLSKSGAIALGSSSSGIVVLSSTQLQSASSIALAGVNTGTYAGWVEAPVIPAPTFAATPPATTLEDAPFSFDPLAAHADPDKVLTFVLEAAPAWLSIETATGKVSGTPLAAHIGTAQVRIKATDGFGVSSTVSFNLQVLEVNDRPVATNLSLVHPEDVAPFTTSLHDRFSDEETADAALDYQLVSNSNAALATATVENGSLRITPVKDAFGLATIIVRATDVGGLSADSEVSLELTPVNDQPVATNFSAVHPEDVAPFALSLHDRFADVETADESLAYEMVSNSNTALATATVANGSLQITPVKDAFGLATIIVRATDVGGLSAESEITLELTPVNDQPVATGLAVVQPEDVPPFALSLHERFADVETGDADLIYELVSNGNTAIVTAMVANGSLQIAPVKDAFGSATIIVRATDVGGLSAESEITLELTPVNDPPVFASQVPDLTGLATGAPLVLELGQFVFDADPGDKLLWALTNVSNPALFSQVSVAPQTGRLDIGFAPYVSGTSDLTVTVSDEAGTSASFTFRVTLPELPLPELAINATLGLNRQTGLYEQRVTITNLAQRAIAGFDLIVSGLPEGVKLGNATGSGEGTWIIRYRSPMAPGAAVVLTLEYAMSVRGTEFTPQLSVVLVTAPEAPSQAAPSGGVPVTRCERLGDGSQLIEFEAVAGRSYEVQYSGDAATWLKSPVPVTAAGNRMQWIDRGPPRTDSPPASVSTRFYRVVELP